MNLVLDEAEEVSMKRKTRKALGTRCVYLGWKHVLLRVIANQGAVLMLCLYCIAGRILLKGDNITLMQTTYASALRLH